MLDGFARWYRGLLRLLLQPAIGRHLSLSVPVRVNETTCRVPIIEGIEIPGIAENWKSRLLARLLPLREGAFVDIGANLGQTLLDLRRVDAERTYVGFEPNPTCVYYLRRLIELNGLQDNSIIIGAAVSAAEGVAPLYSRSGDRADESATIHVGFRPMRKLSAPVHVPVLSLDNVWPNLSTAALAMAKIDVEGAEVEVLTGMRRIISRDRPFLLCEVLPAPRATKLEITRRRHADIEALLQQNAFRIFNIDRDDRGDLVGLAQMERFPLDHWCPETRYRHDYLFVHDEACEEVMRTANLPYLPMRR